MPVGAKVRWAVDARLGGGQPWLPDRQVGRQAGRQASRLRMGCGRLTYPLGAPLGRIAESFTLTVGRAVCSEGKAAHFGGG